MKLPIILLLVILVGCQARPLSPNAQLAELTAEFKTQCVQLCSQEEGESTLTAAIPSGTQLYTTDEALCALRGNALFCARCPCNIEPAPVFNTSQAHNVTCLLHKTVELRVECT
jgi:hypothetical protein